MGKVESIKREVQQLSPTELVAFGAWFIQFDSDAWDRQIKLGAQDGKLDARAEAALAEFHAGQCKPL